MAPSGQTSLIKSHAGATSRDLPRATAHEVEKYRKHPFAHWLLTSVAFFAETSCKIETIPFQNMEA